MSCIKKPKKQQATESEKALTAIARDQYQKYKSTIVPVENLAIDRAKQVGSTQQVTRDKERAVNASREQFSPATSNTPNTRRNVIDLELSKAGASAKAEGAAVSTNKARELQKRTNIVSLGRGISTEGSRHMGRAAAYETGAQEAQNAAHNQVTSSMYQLGGQIAGSGLALYGDHKGWFDKKKTPPPTPKPNSSTGGPW